MFDLEKDASNQRKHGSSLADAGRLAWNTLLIKADTRQDYREDRFLGFGPVDGRLYRVVFTPRDVSNASYQLSQSE